MSSNNSELNSHTSDDQKTTTMTSQDEATDGSKSEINWDTDETNPLNWKLWKRSYHAVLPAVFGLVVFVNTRIIPITSLT
jgi:hypothetical protein